MLFLFRRGSVNLISNWRCATARHNMNSPQHRPLESIRAQLSTEYAEARAMMRSGRVISLNDQLRRSLARIADEIQGAIDDGAKVTEDDLAMLYAAEGIMKNNITEGTQEIVEATIQDNPKLSEGIKKILRGFEERSQQFEKKRRGIENVIERGAR